MIELDRLEAGGLAGPVTSDSNTEGINGNEALPRDADGRIFESQQIQTQAPTTSGHPRNDESKESQARASEVNLPSGSPDVAESPEAPPTQPRRTDTVELDRLEAGEPVALVASNSNTVEGNNGLNEGLPSNADDVSQQIQTQNPTNPDYRNDEESVGRQAQAPGADLSSCDPNGDNAAGGNEDRDDQENRVTSADITYRLPPKVEDYKRSLELALQVGAVSTALIATLSTTILQTYRSEDDWDPHKLPNVVQDIASFSSIIINVSVTLKSLRIVSKLGELCHGRARVEQELVRRAGDFIAWENSILLGFM
ncbi:hypothetical protein PQX77_007172, partial [Marasmius sp. AFHP31]